MRTLYIFHPPVSTSVQGWAQFLPLIQTKFHLRYIHQGQFPYGRRYWNRLYPALAHLLLLFNRNSLTYFPWGDDAISRVRPHKRIFATVHMPPAKWPAEFATLLSRFGGINVLSDEDLLSLNQFAPRGNYCSILHGIDTTFWKPATAGRDVTLVYSGQFMRNLPMFVRVVETLKQSLPNLRVKMLFNPGYVPTTPIPSWVERVGPLNAEELRLFYQSASLMFMPYDNVTASNSICEALACGLPIVTTRVGGMPSYAKGGGMILVENNDDDAAITACHKILYSQTFQAELSSQARKNAEANLQWSLFAKIFSDFLTAPNR